MTGAPIGIDTDLEISDKYDPNITPVKLKAIFDHPANDWRGPIQIGEGRMAGALLRSAESPRETYNVPHRIPWHWQVPAYLVTKAIGAGLLMLAAAGTALGILPASPLFSTVRAVV